MEHECNKTREIDSMSRKLDRIEVKIDDLVSWKFKLIGGSFVVIFIVSIFFKTKLF